MSPEHRKDPLVTAPGARALERLLLEDLRQEIEAVRGDPSLLTRPVLIVASSGTLRRHLAARIVATMGPSVLGLTVSTLWTLARDLLERAGEHTATADSLFEVLARREALEEKPLARVLEKLRAGPGLAVASIRDLLSAGLVPDQGGDPRGLLLSHPDPVEQERALSVVAAARRTVGMMRELRLSRVGDLQARASKLLRERGPAALPYRTVLVHGFADVTGQGADLLAALLETSGGRLYLDEPPDPADGSAPDRGVAFVRGFAERFGWTRTNNDEWVAPDEPTALDTFSASGSDAEAREVAMRIRVLLDGGAKPESIAVVARGMGPYAATVRRHFGALGVPFSGGDLPWGYHPASRRAAAALEILESGPTVAADRWLDALRPGYVRGPLEDLRLGVRALGAARLGDVARLDPDAILGERDSFALPARRGFALMAPSEQEPDEDDGDADLRDRRPVHGAVRRQLSAGFLRWGVERARSLRNRWTARPERAGLGDLAGFLVELLGGELGWEVGVRSRPEEGSLDKQARDLLEALPALTSGKLRLGWEEIPPLLRGALTAPHGLGGRGAGVQVLDVAHARGSTFEHLFLLGLNRDVFPRTPHEDPLLPDAVRRLFASRLPHLHVASESRQEERYLFASLIGSAAHVTLSWQRADEDGRQRSRSPFLVRLGAAHGWEETPPVPKESRALLLPPWSGGAARPRPARDSMRLASLTQGRGKLDGFLSLALQESASVHPWCGVEGSELIDELARARLAALEEWEPDRRTPAGNARFLRPGPFLGFVGPPVSEQDPRSGPLYVTRLEAMAYCGWRTFLRSMLRLEPVPDPFGALPSIDRLLLGNGVHRALDLLFRRSVPGEEPSVASAVEAGPVAVRAPAAEAREGALQEAAAQVAREQGIHLRGIHRALERMARPYLERAVQLLCRETPLQLLGGELEGSATLGGKEIRFRTDQVTIEDDVVVLTDFKTGKALTDAKRAETRDRHLLHAVRSGRRLQVPAYASSGLPGVARVSGRYLFVRPELDDAMADLGMDSERPAGVMEAFREAGGTLLEGLERGWFLPWLEGKDGATPSTCKFCEVAVACGRQDSGYRRRLVQLVEGARERAAAKKSDDSDEALLARLWFLGQEEES